MAGADRDRSGIPDPAVRRLSLYLRELEGLIEEDRRTISSRELGMLLGFTGAQVRKDLTHFGQFGQPGVGYQVPDLVSQLRRILGTDKRRRIILIGAGNLGRALVSYSGFLRKGFDLAAVFDRDVAVIGLTMGEHMVRPATEIEEFVSKTGVRLALLAVPAGEVQPLAERVVAAGIEGILNFAPKRLRLDSSVAVVGVDLAVQLEQLVYQLNWEQASPRG
ncbi:MAG: redox-sensing transcriptional repressor Rex [Phycisphaerales bacterium]|nr:redox-sensing transcriptional repressor Rex [Phycisphaerales bacterium]